MIQREHVCYAMAFLTDLAVAAAIFALCRWAAESEHSDLEVALFGIITFGTYAIACPLAGPLSDRIGRRRSMVIGLAGFTIVTLFWSSTLDIVSLWAACVPAGALLAMVWPANTAWLGEGRTPLALGRVIAMFSIAWNFGVLVGQMGAGIAFEHGPAFVLRAAAALVAVSLALLFIPTVVKTRPNERAVAAHALRGGSDRRPLLHATWVANFANFFTLAAMTNLFPKLAVHLGVPAGMHGLVVACASVAAVLVFLVVMKMRFHLETLLPLLATQAGCVFGLVLIVLGTTAPVLAAGFFLVGINSGLCYHASLFYSLELHEQKGRGTGIQESIIGSAFVVGPVIGGLLALQLGMRSPYVVCAVVTMAAMASQVVLVTGRRRRVRASADASAG